MGKITFVPVGGLANRMRAVASAVMLAGKTKSELSIILVIGYQGEKLRTHIEKQSRNTPIEYIYNPVYNKTNNIYSLYLAKEELQKQDTLLIESDLIFEDTLFHKILNNPYPNLALVAKYEPWMDGTMVRLNTENDIIDFISKKTFRYADIDDY